jgi:uncharacterized protein YihD (DUF1040 family)
MTREEYIEVIIKELHALWAKEPELRLGQLISNTVCGTHDLFYLTDEDLLFHLNESLDKYKEP